MSRSLPRRPVPRSLALFVSAVLALMFVPIMALPATAVGGFQDSDGDMVGTVDWESVAASVIRQDDGTCEGDDTIFGTGSQKNNDTNYNLGCGSVPPNKNDLARAYAYTNTVGDDIYLYLAYALESKTGSAHVDFELNQSADTQAGNGILKVRTVGDILISYDWNGSSEIRITKQTWDGTEWSGETALNGTTAAAGVNDLPTQDPGQAITDPIANTTYEPGTFGEVGINATAAGFFPDDECISFGSATPKTRSSGESFQSELKDYINPFDIALANCASIKIVKVDEDGDPLAGAEFTVSGNGIDPIPCTTNAQGICLIDEIFPDPDPYTVTETQAPTGYFIDTVSKEVVVSEVGATYEVEFENLLGSVRWEKRDGSVQSKALVGGASFTLTATGGDAQSLGFGPLTVVDNGSNDSDPTAGEVQVNDLPKGSYSVEETDAPDGYELPVVNPKTFSITSPSTNTALTGTASNSTSAGSFIDLRTLSKLTVKKFNEDKTEELAGAEFELFRDDNGVAGLQQDSDTSMGSCTTAADGTCSVPSGAPSLEWGYDYYWVEQSPPPGYNFSNTTVRGPIEITAQNAGTTFAATEFTNLESRITTEATDTNLPGGTITDVAELEGVPDNAGGTLTFRLYSDDECTALVYTSPDVAVDGPGTYGGAAEFEFTPTEAGSYYWIATYSGDPENQVNGVAGECGDAGETSVVRPATPGIQTQVSDDSVQLPNVSVTDTATIQPLTANATGDVDFVVYDNDDCAGTPVFKSMDRPISLQASGDDYFATATSGAFSPKEAGTYYWIASYSGDANNEAVSGECRDEGETVVVDKAPTTIATSATEQVVLGAENVELVDTAAVFGTTTDPAPTGTVTFTLYGPYVSDDEQDCSGSSIFDSTVPLTELGAGFGAVSEPFVPTEPGTYLWIASYSGDANNAASSGECGDEGETSNVNKPGLDKEADREVVQPGGQINYTVTASNTGVLAIEDGVVIDTLPPFVTPDEATISNGGTAVLTEGTWTITWIVDIPANGSVDLTYSVIVDEDVPEAIDLINRATFFDLEADDTVRTPLERDLNVLVGDCIDNAPYLFYEVSDAAESELVTITFVNPDGDDVVISGLPLSGRVLWPGSEVDEFGNPTDWPGWRLEDGVWVEGDEFDWVRPTVTVIVETDGSELFTGSVRVGARIDRAVIVGGETVVTYPDALPVCDGPPPPPPPPPSTGTPVETSEPGEAPEPETPGTKLPSTGAASLAALGLLSAALIVIGGFAVAGSRRREENG